MSLPYKAAGEYPPEMNPARWTDAGHKKPEWLARTPQCPKCEKHRVPIVAMRMGFFGINWDWSPMCLECLAAEYGEGQRAAARAAMETICNASLRRKPKKPEAQ